MVGRRLTLRKTSKRTGRNEGNSPRSSPGMSASPVIFTTVSSRRYKEDFKIRITDEEEHIVSFEIYYTPETVFKALAEIKYLDYTAEEIRSASASDSFKRSG